VQAKAQTGARRGTVTIVVCYHAVSATWPSALAVSESLLAAQLSVLARRGYVGLTLADAERRRADGRLPRRTLVITFDDGYASTLRAKPILERLGFPATVFVVTGFVDSGELLSWPGVEHWTRSAHADELRSLTWHDLEELREAGWEVGSHTVSHPHLTGLSDIDLRNELELSRAAIADRLEVCDTIAYPFSLADDRVAAAAARAGYAAGVTLTPSHVIDDRYLRPRVGLYPADAGFRLRLKLSPSMLAFQRTRLADRALRIRARLRRDPELVLPDEG
jgi:peptidoglycan/xylan/chitin deacetylase (PgdA/CDA1 family)